MTSESIPFLSIIVLSPLIGAFLIIIQPETWHMRIRITTLFFASVSLLGSIVIYIFYDQASAGFQFIEHIPIVESLGISYYLAVDGISITLVLLTGIILITGFFASWKMPNRAKEFYILLCFLYLLLFLPLGLIGYRNETFLEHLIEDR